MEKGYEECKNKYKKKEFTCINCPRGCEIQVKYTPEEIHEITGHQCEEGRKYITEEIFSSERRITSTARVKDGELPLVSVKTSDKVPKKEIFRLMDEMSKIEVEAPVEVGQKIGEIKGVGIIATKNVNRKKI